MTGIDPDYSQRDLFNALRDGHAAEWDLKVQAIP